MIIEVAKAEHSNFAEIYSFMNNRFWDVVIRIHYHPDDFRRGSNYVTIKYDCGDD